MAKYDFDFFVIGAGSAGTRASRIAAGHGARVAVAEDRYLGGTCVNVGCVPKKLLVYASHFSEDFEDAAGFGWTVGERRHDWNTLIEHKNREIARLNGIYQRLIEGAGATIINGRARLKDRHTVVIGERAYSADKILVATFKALGMISTPIAFPEVATALQTKVIDFAEGGVNTFYHNKFYDIVKYVADVRHTHQATALIASKATWAKQDAAGQKAIMDAWAHARAFNRKFILDEDKSIQDQVREKGVTITKPDATPFREATRSVYEEFYATAAGKDARKIVDHILSIK